MMTIFGFEPPRRTVSSMKLLAGYLIVLLIAPAAGAADPNINPEVDWARTDDPAIELPPAQIQWPATLGAIWLKALQHTESDLRRQAADSITRAHQLGMPGLDAMAEALMNVLETPDEHPVARTAAARALVEIDARRAAPLLAAHARRGPIELRLSVEPALARWDFEPARAIWLERLANPSTRPAYLQLAIESLGQVAEPQAIPGLTQLAMSPSASAVTRLAAARALAKLPASGLTETARQLAVDPAPRTLVARLVGVHLLANQSGDEALELLDLYAAAPEPTVAAQAMQRLLEIAPARLVQRAASTLGDPDARVRQLTVQALATAPSEASIAALVPVLNDQVPEIRYEARRVLLAMSGRDELRPAVVEHTARALDGDEWRGLEQAILILTELDQKQIGRRLLQLLHHPRPEVYVSAAWGLRELAVPELAEPMFEETKRISVEAASVETAGEVSTALAQLLEAMGQMNYQPAEEHLRIYIPKSSYREEVRAAAIWSLGHLWADSDSLDPELVGQLERRIGDVSIPPETYEVRAMSAVALGRMSAESSLPVLRHWYSASGEGPNTYLGACCGWAIEQITGETLPDPEAPTRQLHDWFLEPIRD